MAFLTTECEIKTTAMSELHNKIQLSPPPHPPTHPEIYNRNEYTSFNFYWLENVLVQKLLSWKTHKSFQLLASFPSSHGSLRASVTVGSWERAEKQLGFQANKTWVGARYTYIIFPRVSSSNNRRYSKLVRLCARLCIGFYESKFLTLYLTVKLIQHLEKHIHRFSCHLQRFPMIERTFMGKIVTNGIKKILSYVLDKCHFRT